MLGASSFIGRRVKEVLSRNYENVYGTYRTENEVYARDITMYPYSLGDSETLKHIFNQTEPDYVISCMRGDFEEQLEMHRMTAEYLAERAGKLIFLSTANVFDAAMECEHFENDCLKSETEYGQFKIKCEMKLQSLLGQRAVIIRIPGVWGRDCPRLVRLIRDIKCGTPVATYKNLFINLTTDVQIAEWILYIIQHDLDGIFHVGTKDVCEYLSLHRRLIASLHLEEPVFDVTDCGDKREVQAVIPGRSEIPDSMQTTISEVIQYVTSN